jgi:hypothetical protein
MDSGQWSEDQRTEYLEIGNWCRHDDAMIYQAAAVFLPLSFGSIAGAFQFPAARFGLLFFSLGLYLYWLFLSVRLSWFSAVRLERARVLEEGVGISHHDLLSRPPDAYARQLGAKLSVRRLRLIFLAILIVAWIATIWSLSGSPAPTAQG